MVQTILDFIGEVFLGDKVMQTILDFRGVPIDIHKKQFCIIFYGDDWSYIKIMSINAYLNYYESKNWKHNRMFIFDIDSKEGEFFSYFNLGDEKTLDLGKFYTDNYWNRGEVWKDVLGKELKVGDFVYYPNRYSARYMNTGIVLGEHELFTSSCRHIYGRYVLKIENLTNVEKEEERRLYNLYKNRGIKKRKFERGDMITNDNFLYVCLGKSSIVCTRIINGCLDVYKISADRAFFNLGSLDLDIIADYTATMPKDAKCVKEALYSSLDTKIKIVLKKHKNYEDCKLVDMFNNRNIGFSKNVEHSVYVNHIENLYDIMKGLYLQNKENGIKMQFILE